MRLFIPCMECLVAFGRPSGELIQVEVRDDNLYQFTCMHGHQTVTVLQQHKFEILFEIGAHAILDGYYREAVSSFASALERFHEFALRVLFRSAGTQKSPFEECWKKVVAQSERQYGAFLFMWTFHFHEIPAIISNGDINFRNNVIHKGLIPNKNQAVDYGSKILDCMCSNLCKLKERFHEEVSQVTVEHVSAIWSKADKTKRISTMSDSTIVNLATNDECHSQRSLHKHLDILSKKRQKFNRLVSELTFNHKE